MGLNNRKIIIYTGTTILLIIIIATRCLDFFFFFNEDNRRYTIGTFSGIGYYRVQSVNLITKWVIQFILLIQGLDYMIKI